MAGYGALANERRYQPAEPAGDEIDQLERLRRSLPPSSVPAWAEVPATLASGALSSVVGGLAGLGTIPLRAMGIPGASPAEVVQSIQQAGTFLPRSIEGMGAVYAAGKAMNALHAPVARAAELTLGATGSPALATAVDVGPTAIGALLGLPGAVGRDALSAARSFVPEIAASRPRIGPGGRRQQGSFLSSELAVGSEDLGRALTMADAGRPVADIWRETLVWPPTRPTINGRQPQPPQGRAISEIPDSFSNANPINQNYMDPAKVNSLLELMKGYDTWMKYANLRQGGTPAPQALEQLHGLPGIETINPNMPVVPSIVLMKRKAAQAELAKLGAPQYGDTLATALNHPELFNALPSLRDTKFEVRPLSGSHGEYRPFEDKILLSNSLANANIPQTFIHEVNHAIQERTGLPPGTDPQVAHSQLARAHAKDLVPDHVYRLLKQMDDYAVYRRSWGEGLANAAARRLGRSPEQRRADLPWLDFVDAEGILIPNNELWETSRFSPGIPPASRGVAR